MPNTTMKEKMAERAAIPNSVSAISGRMVRSKTDHAADEGVDEHQQGKLRPVTAKSGVLT